MASRKPPRPGERRKLGTQEQNEAPTRPDDGQKLSSLMDSVGGMMALPESIAKGRQVKVPPPSKPQSARSKRATWDPRPLSDEIPTVAEAPRGDNSSRRSLTEELRRVDSSAGPRHNRDSALVKSSLISVTETAVSAMPSSSRDLWVLKERDGSFASNVRLLATRVSKIKDTYGYKSFLFSSAGAAEGKTVAATNLALAMSEDSDCKIALIDANFRNPRIASLFNLDNSRGLLTAVRGETNVSECIARVTGRNLIVMTSGGTHSNPGQIISDPKFKSLLADLSKTVDYLFVDAPAALPHADVPLLAQNVDAVMLVTSKENTKAGLYNKAIDTIGKTRIVGSVFIDAPAKRMRPR